MFIGDQAFLGWQHWQQAQMLHEVMWVRKVKAKEIKRRMPMARGLSKNAF